MWVWASDIDNTLTGDRSALDKLSGIIKKEREAGRLFFILCTGRRLDQVLEGQKEEGIPEADAVICQVGTEIYLAPLDVKMPVLEKWDSLLKEQYKRETAVGFLEGIEGLVMQPDKFNTALKTSCYLDEAPNPDAAAKIVQDRVREEGSNNYRVIWSSSKDLDILPAKSGKGNAIQFLIKYLNLKAETVIVSGDSGNDSDMFKESFRGIAVGNAKDELKNFVNELPKERAYLATKEFAAGVEEGLHHFNVLKND